MTCDSCMHYKEEQCQQSVEKLEDVNCILKNLVFRIDWLIQITEEKNGGGKGNEKRPD
jgi:hypothetical protein